MDSLESHEQSKIRLRKQRNRIELPLKALGSSGYHEEIHGGERARDKTKISRNYYCSMNKLVTTEQLNYTTMYL